MFLRILTQDIILPEDIEYSKIIIDEFLSDFAELYGEKNMTFNLHCLQHLPNQVKKYGPLHKCDCFPFEGWFKNTKSLHSGTSNISGQIAKNLDFKLKIHFELEVEHIRKPELKAFVQKNSQSKYIHRNFINKPQNSQILFFNKAERQ